LIDLSFLTFPPTSWSGSVLCNHPRWNGLQLQFYLLAWWATSYAGLCPNCEPHTVTPLYALPQSLRLSKLVYIYFHQNIMCPTAKTGHLPSVDARRRLNQQVQLTYSPDHVDQDYPMSDARQQIFRDGDDSDSNLEESPRNSNNILAKKSQVWHYTTDLSLFLHGSIEGSIIRFIWHSQLQVFATWQLRRWRWRCCQCWWWWCWWWWWWWWWEWVSTWRYGNSSRLGNEWQPRKTPG